MGSVGRPRRISGQKSQLLISAVRFAMCNMMQIRIVGSNPMARLRVRPTFPAPVPCRSELLQSIGGSKLDSPIEGAPCFGIAGNELMIVA